MAKQTFAYDALYGRLQTLTDPSGSYIVHAYDAQGNLTGKEYYDSSTTPVLKRRSTWNFQHPDYPGLLYRQVLSNGTTYSEYDYDEAGNAVSFKDFSGNTTFYAYDVFKRKTSATQPGNITTTFGYDAHGNLASVTDPELHTTTFAYDDMGRVLSELSPERGATTYAYDSAGRLSSKTDARGITLTYTYDALSRPLSVTAPAVPGRGMDDPLDIVYAYDAGTNQKGKLTSFFDPSGDTTLTYDERGRLQQKTSTIAGASFSLSFSLSRTLSAAGRVTSLVYPSGRTVNYTYADCACRVETINTTYSGTTLTVLAGLGYAPFGGANAMSFGNGGTVANVEDLDGRLLTANAGQPMARSYTYDPEGRLTSVSAPATPWFNRDFVYDELGRLTSATGPFGTKGYTYFDSGNRHLESRDASLTGSAGEVALSFTCNQLNELSKVALPTGSALAEYSYNALGQRVAKTVEPSDYKGFLYDFDGNPLCETNAAGATTREYLYRGSSRMGFIEGGAVYYFHNDTTGNPVLITDASKTVVWEGIYEPFGKVSVNSHSTLENNLRFQGQYFDAETGFHYNMRRYYDPRTGRYTTPDPIGLAGGINLYAYVGNDPVNGVDPEGLWAVSLTYYTFGGIPFIGMGGTITFGSQNGVGFFDAQIGVGVGGGVSLELDGGPPRQADLSNSPSNSSSTYVGFSGNIGASIGVGPFGYGWQSGFASGLNWLNENCKNNVRSYYETTNPRGPGYDATRGGRGFGIGFGGGIGVNIGKSWK